jgi:hypothetical protein
VNTEKVEADIEFSKKAIMVNVEGCSVDKIYQVFRFRPCINKASGLFSPRTQIFLDEMFFRNGEIAEIFAAEMDKSFHDALAKIPRDCWFIESAEKTIIPEFSVKKVLVITNGKEWFKLKPFAPGPINERRTLLPGFLISFREEEEFIRKIKTTALNKLSPLEKKILQVQN